MNKTNIWILGKIIPGYRCYEWGDDNMPNLSDCDILIIANSFHNKLPHLDKSHIEKIFDQIRNRFYTGLKIIYVMEETITCKSRELNPPQIGISFSNPKYVYPPISNQFWSPIRFNIAKITPGERINHVNNDDYKQYLLKIKNWYLKLNMMVPLKMKTTCYDNSVQPVPNISNKKLMTNHSNELLSCKLYATDPKYRGRLYLLPPIDNAIELILESIAPDCEEPVPDWVDDISLSGATKIKKNIDTTIIARDLLDVEINTLNDDRNNILKFRKLLYASGTNLEHIVKDSFEFLELPNVKNSIHHDEEDLLFDGNGGKYDQFTVEIKGVDGVLKTKDIRQALDWAMSYDDDGCHTKAVIVANIHRRKPNPLHDIRRLKFGNAEKRCQKNGVCIIPSIILFDWVRQKLDNKKPIFDSIINQITNTDGAIKTTNFSNIDNGSDDNNLKNN